MVSNHTENIKDVFFIKIPGIWETQLFKYEREATQANESRIG
jgi:hypothetical protein